MWLTLMLLSWKTSKDCKMPWLKNNQFAICNFEKFCWTFKDTDGRLTVLTVIILQLRRYNIVSHIFCFIEHKSVKVISATPNDFVVLQVPIPYSESVSQNNWLLLGI